MTTSSINILIGKIIAIFLAAIILIGCFSLIYVLFFFDTYERTLTHAINFYFYIPSFIFFLVLSFYLYFSKPQLPWSISNDKFYDDFSLFYAFVLPIALTILFCFFTYFSILSTNSLFTKNNQLKKIKGLVIEACYEREAHITILDAEKNIKIEFDVFGIDNKFKKNEVFEKEMSVGCWGILYSIEK